MSAGTFVRRALLGIVSLLFIGGVGLVIFIESRFAGHGTYYGRHTNELQVGEVVRINQTYIAAPAEKVIRETGRGKGKSEMYDWSGPAPAGELSLEKGTAAIVKIDPAWDEDSCDPNRPIAVELRGGENRGKTVAVPRNILRP